MRQHAQFCQRNGKRQKFNKPPKTQVKGHIWHHLFRNVVRRSTLYSDMCNCLRTGCKFHHFCTTDLCYTTCLRITKQREKLGRGQKTLAWSSFRTYPTEKLKGKRPRIYMYTFAPIQKEGNSRTFMQKVLNQCVSTHGHTHSSSVPTGTMNLTYCFTQAKFSSLEQIDLRSFLIDGYCFIPAGGRRLKFMITFDSIEVGRHLVEKPQKNQRNSSQPLKKAVCRGFLCKL